MSRKGRSNHYKIEDIGFMLSELITMVENIETMLEEERGLRLGKEEE